ncbi:MAG: hypothetical protein K9L25_05560 [Methylovulum sp.]|nr:hypothetical protein [Methylovulum sp.]
MLGFSFSPLLKYSAIKLSGYKTFMRLKITLKKSIAFLGLIFTPTISYSADLITNGSFSQQLTGWSTIKFTSGCNVTTATERTNVVVKLHHDTDKDWCSVHQEIASKLTKGQIYRFSYRYKTTGVNKKYLGIHFADTSSIMHSSPINEAYNWSHLLVSDSKWHTDSFIFLAGDTLPKSDEPLFAIHFDYGSVGDVYIDNISITSATNQSFESATYDKTTKIFSSPNVIEN